MMPTKTDKVQEELWIGTPLSNYCMYVFFILFFVNMFYFNWWNILLMVICLPISILGRRTIKVSSSDALAIRLGIKRVRWI